MRKSKILMIFAAILMFLLIGAVNADDTNIAGVDIYSNAVGDYNNIDDLKIDNSYNNNNYNNSDSSNDLNSINTSTSFKTEYSSTKPYSGAVKSSLSLTNTNPITHIITNSNYSNFFHTNGSIIAGTIDSGDILYIQGTLTNKNFIVSIPLNIITTLVDGKLINGTITIINSGAGSNVTNLTFVNSNNGGHGVHLTGTENNTIENCSFTLNGVNAFSIPIVRSNYNRIIGNTILQTQNNGGQGQTHSLIVLGDSHYNAIENNTLRTEGSNCIYLCLAAFADFSGSQSTSNNNNIYGNTIYGVSGDWCWGIVINGQYNNIKHNKVRDTQKAISVSGSYNNITNNDLQSKGTGDKAGTGISISGNYNIISNNYINQSTNNEVGIDLSGSHSLIKNNTVFTINGYAIQVTNGENITIYSNSILTKSGKGISIFGTNNLITIDGNCVNSTNGICIILDKASNNKFPKNVIIKNNILNTTAEFAVDVKNADDSPQSIIFEDQNNTIYGGQYRDPTGVISNPIPIFDGVTHYINETNYNDCFMGDGTLSTNINDRDILIFSGNFYNLNNIIINRVIKIIGNNSYFYNTTFKIIIDGARIELINIINSNNIGIIIAEVNNVEINYCNITLNHTKTAYGIWVSKSDNIKISNNIITVKGDFLTFGIFFDGANNCTIEKNIINVTGTGDLYNHSYGTCTNCENGTCAGTCAGGTDEAGDGTHVIPEIYRTYSIILLGSDNNKISNNYIYASSALEETINSKDSQNSIVGIDIYYDSHYNEVMDNYIEIIANDSFLYGMGVLGSPTGTNSSTARGNIFKNNKVALLGSYFVTGFISGENSYDTIIANNTLECWGSKYSYSITLEKSQSNQIINNIIGTSAVINYAIELYGSNDNIILNNSISSTGSYSYGIAIHSSSRNLISYNNISIFGNHANMSLEGTHHDVIPYGNNGVFLMANSTGNNITNNSITSSGEYAINCTDTNGNRVIYNYLNATGINDSVEGKKGKDSIYALAGMNSIERNYYHTFDATIPQISTVVNGTSTSNFTVISETGDVNGALVKFYILHEGQWILFNSSYVNDDLAGFNWNSTFNSMGVGLYQIKAVFSKDGFKDYIIYSNLTLNRAPVVVTILNSSGVKGETVKISVKVTDSRGFAVSNVMVDFYVNRFYVGSNRTNSEGIASYSYIERKGLNVGSYNLKADALISDNHLNGTNEGSVTIKDKITIAVYSNPSEKGKIAIIQAVLKNSAGKTLSGETLYLVIGNSVYTGNTSSNGIVIFGISGLSLGKTKFAVVFADSNNVLGSCTATGYHTVKNHADLIITHVKKSGNYKYKITVENQGESSSKATKIKFWVGKKYKLINLGEIASSKSKTVIVTFFKYSTHKKYTKYVEVNYNKAINETNYKNNKISFKTSNYQRYKADLIIAGIKRSGNNYIITIKNKGTADSGNFKLKIWYGKKQKTSTVKSIAKGKSLTQKFTFFKYSTHKKYTKYAQVNYNKSVVESNYNNNKKKFKV